MLRRGWHYVLLMAATDLSQKLRSALEFGAGVATLMLVTAIAADNIQSGILRSQAAEAFSLMSTVRNEIVVYRAEHGEWPADAENLANPALREPYELGRYVDHLELGQDGALSVIFDSEDSAVQLQNRRFTYRPSVRMENPSVPVVWVCGRHRVLDGLTSSGTDETDIDPINLPFVCREH